MPDDNDKNDTIDDPFKEPEVKDDDSSDEMDIIKDVFAPDTKKDNEQVFFKKLVCR